MAFLPIIEHQQHARIHAHAAPFHALRHLQYRFTCKTLGTNRNTYVSVLGDEGLAGIKVPVEDKKQQGGVLYAVCVAPMAHGPVSDLHFRQQFAFGSLFSHAQSAR